VITRELKVSMTTGGPKIIAVGGFSSDTGKTTLLCDLLRAFPGWEAIKTTRGHYRSCGKDPHSCCVSHLLSDEPVIRSGRDQTYAPGKDTGRYWDAGATSVHWLIATDTQVERGIMEALQRVKSEGVFIEGNSFSEYVSVDALIISIRESQNNVKRSAKRALSKATALYVWRDLNPDSHPHEVVATMLRGNDELLAHVSKIPCYTAETLSDLVHSLRKLKHSAAA
jgi:molybdopterin-guanine dinucleotide biosynthesis protein